RSSRVREERDRNGKNCAGFGRPNISQNCRSTERLLRDGFPTSFDKRIAIPSSRNVIDTLPPPEYARNMRLVGHSDQGGRCDGVQIMIQDGYAYIGHLFKRGFTVLDVKDPKNIRFCAYVPAPPNTWNVHLQVHDNLL